MNIQNLASLAQMLSKTGFEESNVHRLLQHACFKPADFLLTEHLVKGKDFMTCSILFERKGDEYSCSYYEASLIKEIEIPDLVVDSISLKVLNKQMAEIEWDLSRKPNIVFNLNNEESWKREKQIEKIVTDLNILSVTEEGRYFADCLKLKYWLVIPFNPVIGNLNASKSKFEVSQRFYLIDGSLISIEEAYRFLLNRWMEKQQSLKRKQHANFKKEETETSGSSGGKTLLGKKRKLKTNKI